jgi:arylsulfatase A-like enzyme
MRWPGTLEPGSTSEAVQSSLDLFPTFGELAGAEASKFLLDGINLIPALQAGLPGASRELFWELPHSVALRSGAWKYVRGANDEEYLFKIDEDASEKNNLAADRPDLLQRLKQRCAELAAACRQSSTSER